MAPYQDQLLPPFVPTHASLVSDMHYAYRPHVFVHGTVAFRHDQGRAHLALT
jgi:hypothetical protein